MRSRSRAAWPSSSAGIVVVAGRGVDDDGGEPERLVERALRGVDVLDAQHRHQRAGDPDGAVAQVDLLVAHLVAPARPAQLRHDADRDDATTSGSSIQTAPPTCSLSTPATIRAATVPQALGAPQPAGGRARRREGSGVIRH